MQRKAYFGRNIRCHKLEPGDIVLVHKNVQGSDYKIADKWEDEPHEVVSQYKDFPVFVIRPVSNPMAKEQVLHRSMLHPARSVEREEGGEDLVENFEPQALAKANCLMEEQFQCKVWGVRPTIKKDLWRLPRSTLKD